MLVLSRKLNESIIIDDIIEVVVVGVKNGQVKLGIKAPHHIQVHRKEVHEKIKKTSK